MNRTCLLVAALTLSISSAASPAASPPVSADLVSIQSSPTSVANPLQVFRPELRWTDDQYQLTWLISPGYYLYRDKTTVVSSEDAAQQPLPIEFEVGEEIIDELFGPQTIFRQFTVMTLSPKLKPTGGQPLALTITFQGCQEGRLCYPPVTIDLVDQSSATPPNKLTN